MSNQVFVGKGTQFLRWNSSTSTYEALSRVMSIDGLDSTQDTVDITTLDSEGGYREFIGGLRDAGTLSLPMAFQKENYSLLRADFEAEEFVKYQIILPDLSVFEFNGKVTGLSVAVPLEDKVSANATIKISGKPKFFGVDNIESVAVIPDITVLDSSQLAEIGLPSSIVVTLTDETTETLDVTWNAGIPMFNGYEVGVYNFVGTIKLEDGIVNLNGKTAKCKVTVGS